MDVVFPKRELLTKPIASSRDFTRITDSTGPKISSRAIVMSGRTLSKIVGPTKKPAPFAAPDDRFVQELTHLRITVHAFTATATGGRVRRRGYDAHEWFDFSRARLIGISRATGRLLAALATAHRTTARTRFPAARRPA